MKRLRRLRCWWDGFSATWLSPETWAVRLRLLLNPRGVPVGWPAIVEDGHVYDTDQPRLEVVGDREHEWLVCVRCGTEAYQGWRRYYGATG